jgi:hypothetical protein
MLTHDICSLTEPGKAAGPRGWGLGGEPGPCRYYGGALAECAAGAEIHARPGEDLNLIFSFIVACSKTA